ncbi:MAG: hypothetical protein KKB30_00185 [Proteobacteria bacterium]|nr:hypothetical protein [Pseudomonadota bacterium]MBU1716573.1 hypothetical protein [Pseudomonadota bacterium]
MNSLTKKSSPANSPAKFLWLGLMLVIALLSVPPAAEATENMLSAQEQTELLQEANDFFRQANNITATDREQGLNLYRKSLLRFEKLAQSGIKTGKIFYNIGNIHFRLDDLGLAILNYRRAESSMPNDPNLRQNLNYALSKRKDKIEEQNEEKILRTLFFWHYDLPAKIKSSIFILFYSVFWLYAALLLTKLLLPRWPLFICLAIFLLLGGSLLTDHYLSEEQHGVLLTPQTEARKGDGINYQPSFDTPLHAGTEFKLIEDRDNWFYIELRDGRRCWIPSTNAGLI